MIPVELQLHNFMSYGAAAPTLDFERFQVACLSGKNGQGKSALLDAITWAVWGEARKSSGSHKPDDELLRIGTRRMQVEFVFDIEGERYRVVRSYAKSASGKTSKPGLEFHLYEPDTGEYRPLTGATMRETQAFIDNVVGLDYDTFINSAFLLQGRSDEFTKKRPSERKEILTRILNLSRYERLYELASERGREAKRRLAQIELDIERLKEAVAPASEWKEQRAAVKQSIQEKQERLSTLRKEEKALTERLADLEARSREAESVRQSLQALQQRKAQYEQDAKTLRERIAKAEKLIAQRDQIEQEFERYQKLEQERDELDEKRDLYRGIEKQIEQRESTLKDRKNELEKQLHRRELERKSYQDKLSECEVKLAERPSVQRRLKRAREAKEQLDEMNAVLQRREKLSKEINQLKQTLHGQREALQSEVQTLQRQVKQKEQAAPDLDALKKREQQLKQQNERRQTLQERLEQTTEKGQQLAERLKERAGLLEARQQELAKQQASFDDFRQAEDDVCPTCGTDLTPTHRAEVEDHYRTTIQELQQKIQQEEAWIEEQTQRRDELRAKYQELKQTVEELDSIPEQLATVREQRQRAEQEQKALQKQRERVQTLCERLDADAFGQDERERLAALQQELDQQSVDEDELEQLRNRAAQAEHHEKRLRELDEIEGRKKQLAQNVEKAEREANALRQQLDDGTAFDPLPEQIERLKQQLDDVGFDPQRFEQVKRALRELSHAAGRFKDLAHAQQNQADWREQGADVQERIQQAEEEHAELTDKLEQIQEKLQEKAELEERHEAKAEQCREVEAALQDLQVELGQLSAKLEQAQQQRAQLKQQRKEHKEAKGERTLYKHLRAAFGKHGIPSLIIEQTLPDIEERANDLLERLTDGKMHVRLETLKDKKTGGTKETLEIIITDEQGVPRPYETFSGGEAFRVNFALRLALAQLLAERNGVRIRTLVIDEGFGTQDAQGVQNLVESIQTVMDDFDKIVVITHLEELKEAFPVRIEVEKDPTEGSTFEVMGV